MRVTRPASGDEPVGPSAAPQPGAKAVAARVITLNLAVGGIQYAGGELVEHAVQIVASSGDFTKSLESIEEVYRDRLQMTEDVEVSSDVKSGSATGSFEFSASATGRATLGEPEPSQDALVVPEPVVARAVVQPVTAVVEPAELSLEGQDVSAVQSADAEFVTGTTPRRSGGIGTAALGTEAIRGGRSDTERKNLSLSGTGYTTSAGTLDATLSPPVIESTAEVFPPTVFVSGATNPIAAPPEGSRSPTEPVTLQVDSMTVPTSSDNVTLEFNDGTEPNESH